MDLKLKDIYALLGYEIAQKELLNRQLEESANIINAKNTEIEKLKFEIHNLKLKDNSDENK